jgi:hypothetical protein
MKFCKIFRNFIKICKILDKNSIISQFFCKIPQIRFIPRKHLYPSHQKLQILFAKKQEPAIKIFLIALFNAAGGNKLVRLSQELHPYLWIRLGPGANVIKLFTAVIY